MAEPDTDPSFRYVDLDREAMDALTAAVEFRVLDYLETIGAEPAWSHDGVDEVLALLDEPLPQEPAPLESTLDALFDRVIPCSYNTGGPGYLAFIPGGGIYSAALAEYIAAAVNRFANVWVAAPGAAKIEQIAIRWLVEALRLPASMDGVFTTGGSMSNLVAVAAARDKCGAAIDRLTAYVSTEAHYSIAKALRIAGIRADRIRSVRVDSALRLDASALEKEIAADQSAGLVPFFVCASAGTVNTGVIDPLREVAAIAKRAGLWLHIDGAYGGLFRMLGELASAFDGIDEADSIAIDPHKGLFLAYGTGVLLVRAAEDLRRAFGDHASYLPSRQVDPERPDYFELSPELSRDWRGIRIWLPFKIHGAGAFIRALREKRELALRLHEAIASEPGIETLGAPELSLFAFRERWDGLSTDEANARSRALLERINEPREVFLTPTMIDGRFWIRACVLHFRTHAERIDRAIEIIRAAIVRGRGV